MWKTNNVVMLATNDKNNCIIAKSINYKDTISFINKGDDKYNQWIGQHLYITSDEEIKKDDWYYNPITDSIHKADLILSELNPAFKKIIATTDTSLKFGEDVPGIIRYKSLPKIPQQFIQYYIEEYNKGNVITEVGVEYEILVRTDAPFNRQKSLNENTKIQLKVNPDNNINIKPIKNSWSREEVRQLCYQAFIYHKVDIDEEIVLSDAMDLIEPFKEWCIKNNL